MHDLEGAAVGVGLAVRVVERGGHLADDGQGVHQGKARPPGHEPIEHVAGILAVEILHGEEVAPV